MCPILKLSGATLVLACLVTTVPTAQQPRGRVPPAAAGVPEPANDWPDAQAMEKRRLEAENLKLFSTAEPLAFMLTADFKAVQRDRNPESTKMFPATIQFAGDDGSTVSMDLQLRTRGHARRKFETCYDFAPLRLEFPKKEVKGTVFDGQSALKLGTHCREGVKEFEQYVLREYAAYRLYNLLTPRSFRARLAKGTYVDAATKKPLSTRYAMFIEDDDDVAKRIGGRITDQKETLARLDRDTFTIMTMFEYMIGNLDMSIIFQHNVRLVLMPDGTVYPVPYDFDYSGLVDTTYAVPPQGLKVTTVRDRLYRGPCRTSAELEAFFVKFRAIRPEIAPMYDALPDFDPRAKRRALSYLDQFFRTIDRPNNVKTAFMDPQCLKRGLM